MKKEKERGGRERLREKEVEGGKGRRNERAREKRGGRE